MPVWHVSIARINSTGTEALIEAYPDGLTNEELAARTGYSAGGGAYNNPRGRLRSLGLIDYQGGQVRALPLLFLEGR